MTLSTQVILVRHAQTEMITKNRIHGHSDSPLSQKGVQDANKTADRFRGQSFGAFYSSPIGRAMHTAEIIENVINMVPVPNDGLKERYYGWLEGKPLSLFEPDLSGPAETLRRVAHESLVGLSFFVESPSVPLGPTISSTLARFAAAARHVPYPVCPWDSSLSHRTATFLGRGVRRPLRSKCAPSSLRCGRNQRRFRFAHPR